MNNSIKGNNSKEVSIQLERAEVQKKLLIKNIYKEYEFYFQIVRKSLITSAEKGVFGLYSDSSICDKSLKSEELDNFLNKNIRLLINSKIPLITIEQLKLGDISTPQKKLLNVNALKELLEIKGYQEIDVDYENELITSDSYEFRCDDASNTYENYEFLRESELSSVNLDESNYLNSFPIQDSIKKVEYEKNIVDSVLEFIEEKNVKKFNDYSNINDQRSDVFISSDNIDSFDVIDKSFTNFLLHLSYSINAELFKINLIKKIISEDTYKCFSNNNYIIRHPYPFVIRYDLDLNNLSTGNNKSSNIYLLNITNVELEFYNLDLSISRNKINELKNRFRLLNKKQRFWKHKELSLNKFIKI